MTTAERMDRIERIRKLIKMIRTHSDIGMEQYIADAIELIADLVDERDVPICLTCGKPAIGKCDGGTSVYHHYNLCRVHEALSPSVHSQRTPAMALGLTDHVWSIGELVDAALATLPIEPAVTPPDRRRRFRIIDGGKH